ncbi:hypothetical protein, partial [Lysobacter sp.]|uniref:hypothetical protein n=1 Tax=Lysobacter sp. TaxID=72226 RepID=UPI002D734DA0
QGGTDADLRGADSSAGRGIASSGKTLSFGYFSLGQQRKVTRPALDGRKLWMFRFSRVTGKA